nr:RecName: Full=Uncharacterized protein CG10349 [Drosophila melanogaster]
MEEQSPPRDSLLFGPPTEYQQMPKVNLFRVAAIPVDVQLQRIRNLDKDAGHGHGAESPHLFCARALTFPLFVHKATIRKNGFVPIPHGFSGIFWGRIGSPYSLLVAISGRQPLHFSQVTSSGCTQKYTKIYKIARRNSGSLLGNSEYGCVSAYKEIRALRPGLNERRLGAVRNALVFVRAVVCVGDAAAAAVDVDVATPETPLCACARKGRTALRNHRKINARERPLADCFNRPIGIRLPRLQLQLKDNINVNVSGRRSCAAPVGIASDIYIAQNRRIEKTEAPGKVFAAAGTKMNTGQPLKLLDGHCPAPPRPSGADQLRAGGAANLAGSAESYQTTSASVCHSGWLPVPGHLAGCGQRRGCGCGRGFGQAGCAQLGILMNRSKLAPRWHCQLAEPPQQKPLLKRRTVDINNRTWH